MNTIYNQKTRLEIFLSFKNPWLSLDTYTIKYGVISAVESVNMNRKKIKSMLEAMWVNEGRWMIFF
jgi:hypothetical protein